VIQLIFFLLLGAGFLLALFLFWRRDHSSAEGGAEALLEARSALNTLQFNLLPPELIERIFAREDLEFVESSTPAHIREYFLKERKQIALIWINQVRSQIVSLRRFYLGRSRFYAHISVATEISMALNFITLLSECRMVQFLVYLRGPLAAPRVISATIVKAGKVCEASAQSLAFLNSINPDNITNDPTENEAA
jgi:hypothetical protein